MSIQYISSKSSLIQSIKVSCSIPKHYKGKMKQIVVVVVLCLMYTFATDIPVEIVTKMRAVSDSCKAKSGASDDIIKNAVQGEFANDPKTKDYMLCFAVTLGLMTEAGDFQEEEIREHIPNVFATKAKGDEFLATCLVKQATPQDTAFEAIKCFHIINHA